MKYSKDFMAGYNWAALGKDYQEWECAEWKRGYNKYHSNMTLIELIRWH